MTELAGTITGVGKSDGIDGRTGGVETMYSCGGGLIGTNGVYG